MISKTSVSSVKKNSSPRKKDSDKYGIITEYLHIEFIQTHRERKNEDVFCVLTVFCFCIHILFVCVRRRKQSEMSNAYCMSTHIIETPDENQDGKENTELKPGWKRECQTKTRME